MPLSPGTILGTFEISGLLGVGGMGEVYRARDSKLGREVAIKVLPEAFAKDRDRLARFEREAKLLAALDHPNIAGIYDLQEAEGIRFLVMQLAEGTTLAERISLGPIPVDETLPMFAQIAEALESAHEHGVIHRDLKPANIKVSEDGKVKVLDFGLAKAFGGDSASSNPSESPTLVSSMTTEGMIAGTAPYMSPEQARGKSVDKRTDIWAFGCCLYEALTGRRPFLGNTTPDVIAKILESEPDWDALPNRTPARVRVLLWRCLQKDSRRRLRDIGEALFEIGETSSDPSGAIPAFGPTAIQAGIPKSRVIVGAVACVILGGLIALALLRRPEPAPPKRIAKASIVFHEAPLRFDMTHEFALSPTGGRLVYTVPVGDSSQLYVRDLSDRKSRPLRGTLHGHDPFFSPDGRWVGYFDTQEGMLKKIPIDGGAPISICEADTDSRSASWSEDGTIVFPSGWFSGLFRVSADGGAPETLTTLDLTRGERTHRYAQVLPGAKAVLFMAGDNKIRSFDDADIMVYSFETREIKTVISGGAYPRYAPTGHIVYGRAGQLLAVAFDLETLQTMGPSKVVLDGVTTSPSVGAAHFDFSSDGTLVYMPGGPEDYYSRVYLIDRFGERKFLNLEPRIYVEARFSPDGERLLLSVEGANATIWSYDLKRTAAPRLLPMGPGNHSDPLWDGSDAVIYFSVRGMEKNISRLDLGANEPVQVLLESDEGVRPSALSPDRRWLIYERGSGPGEGIWMLPMEGSAEPELLVNTPGNEMDSAISSDGRWMAYASDESGRYEVSVVAFPEPGRPIPVSNSGGILPVWSPEGDELFYLEGNWMVARKIMGGDIGEIEFGEPERLFEFEVAPPPWDVSPDGQQFVAIESSVQSGTRSELHVVFNWFEELKRLAPLEKN